MKADFVFVNGPIYSGVHSKPFRYLAIAGNRVLAIGRGSGKQYIGRNTISIDLKGKGITPGITDSHLHLLDYAWSLGRMNVESCKTSAEVTQKLQERAQQENTSEWILGRGWNREQFGGFPHKKILDEIFPDRPVALNSRDGHFLWTNSLAIRIANLTGAEEVNGGYLGKDSAGKPDGILGENAVELITRHISKPDSNARKNSLLTAQKRLHEKGITGLHSTEGNQAFGDLQDLHSEKRLCLRVFHSIPLSQLEEAVRVSMKSGLGDSWFRFGFVKIFSDGTLGSHSASMLEPFQGTDTIGMDTISEEDLTAKIRLALRNGIAVGVHAIGDRANRQTLNAFENNSELLNVPAAKSRIEHVQLLHPNDISRFKKIGIIASMQPHHAISDCTLAETYWGSRADYAYAWQSLRKAGATMIFGSDAPIENPDPMEGLSAAVHRANWNNRFQTISPIEALSAYTIGPAIASGEGSFKGSLEPGKVADFVLFSEDPIRDAFQNCRIVATVIDGKFVYQNF
jgi:predicted amidohydrolase YtcJ